MTGSILQLVARGADDVYIYNNPHITFFKKIYKRHTNFSKTEHKLYFKSDLDFGNESITYIKTKADLTNRMFLIITLPDIEIYYETFTYQKLYDILIPYDINVKTLYYTYYNTQIIMTDTVNLTFFNDAIPSTINNKINDINTGIYVANQTIQQINQNNSTVLLDITSYLNPDTITPPPTLAMPEHLLNNKYNIVKIFLSNMNTLYPTNNTNITSNMQMSFINTMYNYIYDLYNTIDNHALSFFDLSQVKNIVDSLAIRNLYMLDSMTIYLIPGYQDPSVIGSPSNPIINQHNFVGENLMVHDAINIKNADIVMLDVYANDSLQQYFVNLIYSTKLNSDVINELDTYHIFELLFANQLSNNTQITSTNNIISVRNYIAPIIYDSFYTNLLQFTQLLTVFNNFRYKHDLNETDFKYFLQYPMFYPSLAGSQPSVLSLVTDMSYTNLLYYDKSNSTTTEGYFYQNWIKQNTNSFFRSLSDIFLGLSSDTTNGLFYKFISYYNDIAYMSYYNLTDNQLSPTNLSSILSTTGISLSSSLVQKIKLLEFTPFIMLYNLYTIMNHGSLLYGSSIVWANSNFQYSTYNDFLVSLYSSSNTVYTSTRLSLLNTTIYNGTLGIISANEKIVTNFFTPLPTFSKYNNTSSWSTTLNLLPQTDKDLLGYIYVSYTVSQADFTNVPDVLFPNDVLIIMMACDILYDLSPSTPIAVKKLLMKIFYLYLLSYDEIPKHTTTNIDPAFYNYIVYPGYINQFTPTTVYNSIVVAYNVHRMASIWNHIQRMQMASYNNLVSNTLLTTAYYRKYYNSISNSIVTPQIGLGYTIGLGITMYKMYELFVSHFYNYRLGVNTVQSTVLEFLLQSTNFFAMDVIDPYQTMHDAIVDITANVINDITTIKSYNSLYISIYDIVDINLNKSYFYYNTLFNIVMNNVLTMNFNINSVVVGSNTFYNLNVDGITFTDSNIIDTDGYVAIIIKTYGNTAFTLSLISMILVKLQIVPMANTMNLAMGTTYYCFNNNMQLLTQANNTNQNKTCMDFLMHLNNQMNNTESSYLNYLVGIDGVHINQLSSNFPSNIHYYVNYNSTVSQPNAYYLKFLSPTNVQGNIYNNKNVKIVGDYWSFENPYGVLKYLLDAIILDISKNPQFMLLFGKDYSLTNDSMYDTYNSNNLTQVYENSISEMEKQLKVLSNGTNNVNKYINSPMYDRLNSLANTLVNGNVAEFAWSKYIGFNIIDYIKVTADGETIDTQSGTFMYVDYLLNKSSSHQYGDDVMLGNMKFLTSYDFNMKRQYKLIIPLRFWFCKFINESLPMISLLHTKMHITVKLKKLSDVAYWNKYDTYFSRKVSIIESYIFADYVYIDNDERISMSKRRHEYLIDIVQRNGPWTKGKESLTEAYVLSSKDGNYKASVCKVVLHFNNMCKDLIWMVYFKSRNETEKDVKNRVLDWNDYDYGKYKKHIKNFRIEFDGVYREDWKKYGYYNLYQPYTKGYSSLTDGIFLYSFALNPKFLQPSGMANIDSLTEFSVLMEISDEMANMIKAQEMIMVWEVYSRSTNVWRVMSGKCGLVFYGQ